MNYVELVAIFSVIQLVYFGILVGKARGKYGIKAPAVTGHEHFERAYRVQMNTIELMVAFLPSLFVAAKYWPQSYVAIVGFIYLIGRFIYWRSYTAAPETRGLGFAMSMGPILALIIGSMVAILRNSAA